MNSVDSNVCQQIMTGEFYLPEKIRNMDNHKGKNQNPENEHIPGRPGAAMTQLLVFIPDRTSVEVMDRQNNRIKNMQYKSYRQYRFYNPDDRI